VAAFAARILGFQRHYEQLVQPFEWKLTRRDLDRLMVWWSLAPLSRARLLRENASSNF
jgi:hypothetical protein